MNINELRFCLEQYLSLRHALGFQLRGETVLTHDFVNWLEAHNFVGAITAQQAVEWACSGTNSTRPGANVRRLSAIRGFLTYLHASVPETQVPERGLLGMISRPKPYIYSKAQIWTLLETARLLRPKNSLRPFTYTTLIGLLLSCGLRISEAIKLRVDDVELEAQPPRLKIQQTKFGKSRIVPMHPTTADALRSYSIERARLGYDGFCDTFFVSEKLTPLNINTVEGTFITLTRRAGLRGSAGEPGPTLHSLRHTFVVERLLMWYQQGDDVRIRLPELSVFLGHSRQEHTYWYLTATPQLLTSAAKRFETYANKGGECHGS